MKLTEFAPIYDKMRSSPCPFCGESDLNLLKSPASMEVYVACRKCDAEGPRVWVQNYMSILEAFDAAADKWINRVNP